MMLLIAILSLLVSPCVANPAIASRIVHGHKSKVYSYPSIVSLLHAAKDGTMHHYCGGILLKPDKVLTAAHCTDEVPPEETIALLGAVNIHDRDLFTGYEQFIEVAGATKHDGYAGKADGMPHDIAMLTLTRDAELNSNVQLATLAETGESFAEQTCVMVGWGKTNGFENGGASHLKEANITKIVNDECQEHFWHAQIRPEQLCVFAQDIDVKPTTCKGDSGGPLYCRGGAERVLAGVTSWGETICTGAFPAVFSRVSEYLDWIHEHL